MPLRSFSPHILNLPQLHYRSEGHMFSSMESSQVGVRRLIAFEELWKPLRQFRQGCQDFSQMLAYRRFRPVGVMRRDRIHHRLMLADQPLHRGCMGKAQVADAVHLRLGSLDYPPRVFAANAKGDVAVEPLV